VTIQHWHVGKIILLWAWGLVLMLLAIEALRKIDNPVVGFALMGIIFLIPLSLSALTWRWLGGKER
jgi:hypothetical protein